MLRVLRGASKSTAVIHILLGGIPSLTGFSPQISLSLTVGHVTSFGGPDAYLGIYVLLE